MVLVSLSADTNNENGSWRKSPVSDDSEVSRRSSGMVMEKVTILRMGELLDSKLKSEALKKDGDDLVVVGTQRFGPDPEKLSKQIRIVDFMSGGDVYAGSAFAMSPAPSALPLPSFSKRQVGAAAVPKRDHFRVWGLILPTRLPFLRSIPYSRIFFYFCVTPLWFRSPEPTVIFLNGRADLEMEKVWELKC